jgi:hypothetical protein
MQSSLSRQCASVGPSNHAPARSAVIHFTKGLAAYRRRNKGDNVHSPCDSNSRRSKMAPNAASAGVDGPLRNCSRLCCASAVRIVSAYIARVLKSGGGRVGMRVARITPARVPCSPLAKIQAQRATRDRRPIGSAAPARR